MLLKISHLCACLGLLSRHQPTPILSTIRFQFTTTSERRHFGSFTYDSATSLFSNFLVEWDIHNFDLTAAANAPPRDLRMHGFKRNYDIPMLSHQCGTDGWVATVTSAGPFPMPFTGFPSRSSALLAADNSQPTARESLGSSANLLGRGKLDDRSGRRV
jgi:hypothetical protein